MLRFLSLGLIVLVMSTLASDMEERRERLEQMEASVSLEAAARKARSEAILRGRGVPINDYLPHIEDESQALVRTREEIAVRAMALLVVAVKAEGLEQDIVDSLVQGYGLADELSPDERRFIVNPNPASTTEFSLSGAMRRPGSCSGL